MLTQAIKPARRDTPAIATLGRSDRTDRQGNAVAEEGSPTPRRALGPLPGQPGSAADDHGDAFPDDPSPLTSTGRLRRLAFSPSSPASPVSAPRAESSTPVPPPAPVLPEPEAALPPASGRRFSATDDPFEHPSAAPRRSAVSPASPPAAVPLPPPPRPTSPPSVSIPGTATFTPSPYAPSPAAAPLAAAGGTSLPPAAPQPNPATFAAVAASARDEATPPVSTDGSPDAPEASAPKKRRRFGRKAKAEQEAAEQPVAAQPPAPPAPVQPEAPAAPDAPVPEKAPKSTRSSRPALIVISAVAAVALLVAAGVWLLTLRSGASSGSPTNPDTASALDPLVTAADLGTLGGLTWTASTATSDPERPICLPDDLADLPQAQRAVSRKTSASDDPTASFVQTIATYADDAAATQAYAARTVQAGTCSNDVAWITGANSVSGLADQAISERLVVQDATAEVFHTLLISRTGRSVSLVDVTTNTTAVNALDLADVVGKALSRQCGGEQGTCPSSIEVATVPPPAGDPVGWLVEGDVPRITPGEGRWGTTEPKTTLDVIGSQCEAMSLESVPGTTSAAQRTLLLADDNAAPNGFGIDMVTYTFGSAKDAASLGKKLSGNIAKCPDRAPTATVKDGPTANGTGMNELKFTGDTYEITQDAGAKTLIYRVAVLTVGDKVVYLLANPTADFDFSDSQWKAIAVRAGQRVTQS